MGNYKSDLEHIIDLDMMDQPDEPEHFHQDQYSIEAGLLEIDQAIKRVQEPPERDVPEHPEIIEIKEDVEIIKCPPAEPKILRRIDPFKEGW